MSKEIYDPLSMYDNPVGDIPVIPIGQLLHKDGNGAEISQVKETAEAMGAEFTSKPQGEYNSIVIKHPRWVWVGGALATAMGLTAAGIATAFAIEHHHRKNRK